MVCNHPEIKGLVKDPNSSESDECDDPGLVLGGIPVFPAVFTLLNSANFEIHSVSIKLCAGFRGVSVKVSETENLPKWPRFPEFRFRSRNRKLFIYR
jgi:hypothetical protein